MSILLSLVGSNVPTASGGGGGGGEPLAFTTLGFPRIPSNSYMGSTADYNGPYDVRSVTIANAGTNVRINISLKVITNTTYVSDWCIGGVQLFRGGTKTYDWIFSNSTGGTGSGWQWNLGGTQLAAGRPHTVTDANARTYQSITSTISNRAVNWASSTSSSNTGCAGGISSTADLSSASTFAQVGSNYYVYNETTSPTALGDVFYIRSPQINVQAGDVIYVAGACATNGTWINTFDDAVFIGVA